MLRGKRDRGAEANAEGAPAFTEARRRLRPASSHIEARTLLLASRIAEHVFYYRVYSTVCACA